MSDLKVNISKQLKRLPPLFDVARRTTRLLGDRTPIYDLLAKISRRLSAIAFVQIGSNDGISVDPLREFIVGGAKWHGVLVEPVPQIFEQLRRNYSYLHGRNLTFFNVAVSNRSGTKKFWKIKDACLGEFPLFAYQIGSFDREHILKHFPAMTDLESKLEAIEVPCKTYEEIRCQAGLSTVDVLHLDVEGHEQDILSSIHYGVSKPRIILFEISHMTASSKSEVFQMLQGQGYRLQEADADCIATLPNMD